MELIFNSLWMSIYALLVIVLGIFGIFTVIGMVYEHIRDKMEYNRKHKEAEEIFKRIGNKY